LFWIVAILTALCAIATVVTQNIVRSATWLLFTLAGTSMIFFLLGADFVGAVQLLVYVGGTLVLVVFGVMLTAQGPFINMRTSGVEWAVSVLAGVLLLGVLVFGTFNLNPERKKSAEPAHAAAGHAQHKHAHEAEPIANAAEPAPAEHEPGHHEPAKFVPTTLLKPLAGSTVAKYAPAETAAQRLAQREEARQQGKAEAPPETISHNSTTIGQSFLGVGLGPAHADPANKETVVRAHYLLPFELVSVHLLVVLIGAAYLARTKRRRGETA
jgi:NADH-quinone oxidoreductase subunit J